MIDTIDVSAMSDQQIRERLYQLQIHYRPETRRDALRDEAIRILERELNRRRL